MTDIETFLQANPPAPGFKPYSHVCRSSDSLTAYFKGDADYSEQLTPEITLYRSLETNEIVGCRIDGIYDRLIHATLSSGIASSGGCNQ